MGNYALTKFDDLCDTLNLELQFYEELIIAMKHKQNSIVQGNKEKIKEAIYQEREASQNILKQMEVRNELARLISTKTESQNGKNTLLRLIQKADEKSKIKLMEIRRKMHLSVIEIDKLNSENKYLLSASIVHVKDLVKVFLTAGEGSHFHYGINGSMKNGQKDNRVLDFRI
ncbi:MAG: hypothetical protein CMG69_05930 [Candidatus Marinimicrobia bacterium]|nr:hypothetical protein [Candidatus Neomarinimicrobiota bacterium]|tara:strand:+ start:9731 stop:10246 length:516 start_codon:yes stop_codon:yes gene_type:complete